MPCRSCETILPPMKVDAIVNAANESLLGGGGVDGAIHWAAGPVAGRVPHPGRLQDRTGQDHKSYRLPAKFVIHTVGPIWRGGSHGRQELLVSAYRSSLELALSNQCETVAFPLISSGCTATPRIRP